MNPTEFPMPTASFDAMREQLWEGIRRPTRVEDRLLLSDTLAWLNALPLGARPRSLPQRFPRIANELCRLWVQPEALGHYLDELLVDRRGGRQGFPPLVREELEAIERCVERERAPFDLAA